MTLLVLAYISLVCAAVPALLYVWNSFLFREPPLSVRAGSVSDRSNVPPVAYAPGSLAISVLIPARNEERGIAACVESVLASRLVNLEAIVLDDHSTDRTAEIVREIASKDPRVRVELAPPLPDGWCGKQAACFALSKLAKHDVLTFLDADVRLEPEALARMALFMETSKAALVSGFPRQETGTFLEKLLIPLIHWLLLCWLPLWAMRRFRWSAFGAGCGQWFMTTRNAYEKVGGHEAVKSSLHDGLQLPRAYRRAGFMTDICDATNLATCRMYHSAEEVWFGLTKNAREGMAATGQIGFWTVLLFGSQVFPFILLSLSTVLIFGGLIVSDYPIQQVIERATRPFLFGLLVAAYLHSLGPRFNCAVRFRQSWLGVVLHPIAILVLLAIQWYALIRSVFGKPVGWKGRAHPACALS